MIVPSSTYWPIAFGREKGDVIEDEEGVTTAKNLGTKMGWLIGKTKGSD